VVVLLALFFVGPDSTKDLALTLIVGMIAGSYSSILLAAPMLIFIEKHQKPAAVPAEKA
jgi:preprotein translocase subunit SecF